MKKFEQGERVEVIDDNINGIVIAVSNNFITIRTNEGFDMDFEASELMHTEGLNPIKVSNFEAARVKADKEQAGKRKTTKVRPKERNVAKMEVDLHIHQLVPSSKGMSNYDILNIQLETAKRQLEFALSKRIQKVVFIHGVGAGVLKEELNYLFKRYENVKYYDADYQKYGLGATEVYIYQNP
ncbi:Smr/MutS family protein [uncultured Eudoraea sp.]|uniref:Smr/MutS family protein n=1 Tax=uncultured Eudoraea sp. TaxID=1035614 RepID=UPI002606A14B|nr:Smr/MutS family protein [uncultured Eudoraea sp.]